MLAALWMIAVAQTAPALGTVAQRAPPVFSVEPTSDGIRLVAPGDGVPVELSNLKLGPVVDVLRHGSALYAALVAGGVAVVDVRDPAAPVVAGRLVEGRKVQRLGHQGAEVLVLLFDDRDSAAFSLADPLHPLPAELAAAAPVVPSRPAAQGTVLGVRDGTVVIEGGTNAGFEEGGHVAIVSRRASGPSDAAAHSAGMAPLGLRTAVIALDRVEADRSLGHLGRGDRAEVGDSVEATADDLTGSVFFPRANQFSWRLWTTLRPFLDANAGSQAAGMLIDFMVAYHFPELPLRLEAGIEPLGFAAGASKAHDPLAAVADVAYSTPYFELGLGSGVSALASATTGGTPACTSTTFEGNCPPVVSLPATQSALVVETLRLGALDGANFLWTAAAGVVPGQGFQLLSVRGEVNVPIVSRLTAFAGGGGGLGYFYGEVGVRTYLNGVGGPGTVILSGGVGGAEIEDNAPEVLAGPALNLGAELRL